VNLSALTLANRLRREAHISNDDPILHAAADRALSRAIHEHRDMMLVRRAHERRERFNAKKEMAR
jgi:hypothetical protein